MLVAVTAQGASLDSPMDPRFGRASQFLLIDTATGEVAVHDNAQNLNALQGAGIQAAQNIARLRAQAVVTGHVGPKAFAVLKAAGVVVYTGATGTVRESLEALLAGRLQAASGADVEGHWV